jgi:hypothetical protein
MKKIGLMVACFCATGLSSCSQYSKTELSLANYLDYFEIGEGASDAPAAFNSGSCTWEAPKDVGASSFKTFFNAAFFIKSDKLENMYYDEVKFTYKVNLYYGKSTISASDTPDYVIDYTSQLHYFTVDGEETYVVGISLLMYLMFYYEANNKSKSFEISYLKSDYASNNYQGTNYYRQIKLTGVSGTVSEGGLSGANAHHCN